MHFKTLLSLLLTSGLNLAAAEIIGDWSLWNFARRCVEAGDPDSGGENVPGRCAYSFSIAESAESYAPRAHCTILYYSPQGSQELAAQSSWYQRTCEEPEAAQYRVSSGWDARGFITVTVHNPQADADAFFGYTDAQLGGSAVVERKTEPAYRYGTFGPGLDGRERLSAFANNKSPAVKRNDDAVAAMPMIRGRAPRRPWSKRHEHEEAHDGECDPDYWIVNKFTRSTNPNDQMVFMGFNLIRCDSGTHCALATNGAANGSVDIAVDGFHNVRCLDSKHITVSWGYKKDTDGGVMTVMDLNQGRRVFVGWDNVNSRVDFSEEGKGSWEPYPPEMQGFTGEALPLP